MSQKNNKNYGSFAISPSGAFKACTYTTIKMTYKVGPEGLATGGVLKVGLPNMGWSEPFTPYARGCPEVYKGKDRQIAKYYPCNTTCRLKSKTNADIHLQHRCSQNILGPI